MVCFNVSRRAVSVGVAGLALALYGTSLCNLGPSRIMIIRHREKPSENSPNPDCRLGYLEKSYQYEDKSGLTKQGWNNALALVKVFSTPTDPLIRTPKTIFASAKQAHKSDRERLTVEPLAAQLSVKINDHFAEGEEEKLFDAVTEAPGPVLICWHHTKIFDIGKLFRAKEPIP